MAFDASIKTSNEGAEPVRVRAAMPYLSGLGISTSGEEDRGLVMLIGGSRRNLHG